jgi:hypothetical protein
MALSYVYAALAYRQALSDSGKALEKTNRRSLDPRFMEARTPRILIGGAGQEHPPRSPTIPPGP